MFFPLIFLQSPKTSSEFKEVVQCPDKAKKPQLHLGKSGPFYGFAVPFSAAFKRIFSVYQIIPN